MSDKSEESEKERVKKAKSNKHAEKKNTKK